MDKKFDVITEQTCLGKCTEKSVDGFICRICDNKNQRERYIFVFEDEKKFEDTVMNEGAWDQFQKDVFRLISRRKTLPGMVTYMLCVLDGKASNLPVQYIESNTTHFRTYLFTVDEAITFVNGIVSGTEGETSDDPVKIWADILEEVQLTGVLTEPFRQNHVESYLAGNGFKSTNLFEEKYELSTKVTIPDVKWIDSIRVEGFRNFCFDRSSLAFGQVNLLYGANGSGKTSVLEGVEYAMTSDIGRMRDFSVKMDGGKTPDVTVYDHQAELWHFNPDFSKANARAIEKKWYGVPSGRTQSTLGSYFNRINYFDSESVYSFIHETNSSSQSYEDMFGNFLFGDYVLDCNKKWTRYKTAFETRLRELQAEDEQQKKKKADLTAQLKKLEIPKNNVRSLEAMLKKAYVNMETLHAEDDDRYKHLLDSIEMVKKYVDLLAAEYPDQTLSMAGIVHIHNGKNKTLIKARKQLEGKEKELAKAREEMRPIIDHISQLKMEIKQCNRTIDRPEAIRRDIRLNGIRIRNKAQIDRIDDILEERKRLLSELDRMHWKELFDYYDKLRKYDADDIDDIMSQMSELRDKRIDMENHLYLLKKEYSRWMTEGKRETQKAMELAKMGLELVTDETCPLCGSVHGDQDQLRRKIRSRMESYVSKEGLRLEQEIREYEKKIKELRFRTGEYQHIISNWESLCRVAQSVKELQSVDTGDLLSAIRKLREKYLNVRREIEGLEKVLYEETGVFGGELQRKKWSYMRSLPIFEQYCKEADNNQSLEEYITSLTKGDRKQLEELKAELEGAEKEADAAQLIISKLESRVNEFKKAMSMSEVMKLRNLDTGLQMIQERTFQVSSRANFSAWYQNFCELYSMTKVQVTRINHLAEETSLKTQMEACSARLSILQPQIKNGRKAVRAMHSMPTLSSFVDQNLKANVKAISGYFMMMHHSGEFSSLGMDKQGLYALRGIGRKVRTYEMSTGQRASVALAVMLASHMAASASPQFLMLDEPFANMDRAQVLNALDIFRHMAEQGTQLFLTTANGEVVHYFKETFRDTQLSYKEFEFVKRANKQALIMEHDINDAPNLEQLSMEDLAVDHTKLSEIRQTLEANQKKLHVDDKEEQGERNIPAIHAKAEESVKTDFGKAGTTFWDTLDSGEVTMLTQLIHGKFVTKPTEKPIQTMRAEAINSKAIEYFGEGILEAVNGSWQIYPEYVDELKKQREKH